MRFVEKVRALRYLLLDKTLLDRKCTHVAVSARFARGSSRLGRFFDCTNFSRNGHVVSQPRLTQVRLLHVFFLRMNSNG